MFSRSTLRASSAVTGTAKRTFSSTPRALDLARVTLIGRLTSDPQLKSSDRSGVSYVLYSVATNTGPLQPADSEDRRNPAVNYHSVFSFNERANERLVNLTKGSKVFVEADLQLKDAPPTEDGAPRAAPTSFLTHRSLQLLARPRSSLEGQEGEGEQQ